MGKSGKIRGVVFDLDGTVVDSLAMTFDAFNHAITTLGGEARTPEQIMEHFGLGEGEIFARMIGRENAERAYALAHAYTDRTLRAGDVPLFAGIIEVLDHLAKAQLPVSIFTGRSADTTELILAHHGIRKRFATVVCHDHVSSAKPSPEGLLLCCTRMGLPAADVLMIGDSAMDLIAARRAGSPAIGAHWDRIASPERLAQEQPRALAASPAELLAHLLNSLG